MSLKRRKGNDANHISLKKYFRKHYTLHAVYIWIRSLALLVPCVYFSADLSLINSFFITSVMSEMTEHFCVVQYPDLVNLIHDIYMIDDFLTQSNSGLLLFVHHFGFLWSSLCSLTSTRNRFSVILTPPAAVCVLEAVLSAVAGVFSLCEAGWHYCRVFPTRSCKVI